MQSEREYYQLQDSYFFIINPFIYGIFGVLAFVGIILFFVWKRRKGRDAN